MSTIFFYLQCLWHSGWRKDKKFMKPVNAGSKPCYHVFLESTINLIFNLIFKFIDFQAGNICIHSAFSYEYCYNAVSPKGTCIFNAFSIFPASVHQFRANLLVFVNINQFLYNRVYFSFTRTALRFVSRFYSFIRRQLVFNSYFL